MQKPILNPDQGAPARGRRLLLVAGGVALVTGFAIFAGIGGEDPGLGVLTALDRLLVGGSAAAAYLAGGVGLGRLVRPLWRGSRDELALQVGAGLAMLLWLSHLLGWLGLLGGPSGPFVAIGVVAVGVVLAAHQFITALRGKGMEPAISPFGAIGAVGVSILLVAACNPPGSLWGSEFGGYDVLEYHLELPQEWLAAGRISPLAHNVYSYLPSYMEAAYTHLGAMTLAPHRAAGGGAVGLAAGEGYRLMACQFLHAGFAMIAAWLTSRLVRSVGANSRAGGALACALMLVTPWTLVVGSMAYNEMGLVAFLAAALIAASNAGPALWKRGVLTGLLVGTAASVKPTGLLFAGVPAGIMLFGLSRPREWLRLVIPGCVAGMLVFSPWLTRNYIASGNPVFPFATSIFGVGRWTADQVARYTAAHSFHGSVVERLRLLILPDTTPAPNGQSSHRGMLHPQWGLLLPLTLMAIGAMLTRRGTGLDTSPAAQATGSGRRAGSAALLGIGLAAQVLLWLFTGHLQSRFLMPLLPMSAALCGLAVARLSTGPVCMALLSLPLLGQLTFSIVDFTKQRSGQPNALLIPGPGIRTGQVVREMSTEQAREVARTAPPELFINIALPETATVYLLGDATPLYFTRHTLYNTTYDTWLLAPVEDPGQWSANLRDKGVDFVLVNLAEIARLQRSGYAPPGITAEAVEDWMSKHTVLVRDWEKLGVYLVRPIEPSTRPASPQPEHK